jgi:alkylhydroperoxidase family enzyme
MKLGVAWDKLQAVEAFRTSPLFDARERAALDLAERMTITGRDVSDEAFAALRGHFSEPETVELVAIVGLENLRSRMNRALRIEANGLCLLPGAPRAAPAAGR